MPDRLDRTKYTIEASRLFILTQQSDAHLVVNWCRRLNPTLPEEPDFISTDTAAAVYAVLPSRFDDARTDGWLDGYYNVIPQERDFLHCRRFVFYAARTGRDIKGGRS